MSLTMLGNSAELLFAEPISPRHVVGDLDPDF